MKTADYPLFRSRRTRRNSALRELVAEVNLRPADLIQPLFLTEGDQILEAVPAMPGVSRMSIDLAAEYARKCKAVGLSAIALFPATPIHKKTDDGREALNPDNLVCRAVRAIKIAAPDLQIIGDVALDPYTTHGHDGVLNKIGDMDNDATIEILVEQALTLASAGVDIVAPSDMTDGRIGKIRLVLEKNHFPETLILSYAVKYASAFYGPFRNAVGSRGVLKTDKKTYQMDYRNIKEALNEARSDIAEGADLLMVKPASVYSDMITRLTDHFDIPVFAYQVSGEYSGLKLAAEAGCFDFHDAMIETLTGLKRAGARAIFTYAACEIAEAVS